jgi:hypothetical protein
MKPVLKQKWIEALRNAKFRQGHGRLTKISGGVKRFCCLGVLRHIANPKDRRGKYKLTSSQLSEFGISGFDQNQLFNLNDGSYWDKRKFSFLEISNWIEKHL